ncbi:MAG: hypothetical protein ABS46_20690 [Cytophagaceae bacterium SCN 52-12]|nr:MAG: hypothetical protein ABS46_20690 [Cytophagaceae bacterium SCN 52-12]
MNKIYPNLKGLKTLIAAALILLSGQTALAWNGEACLDTNNPNRYKKSSEIRFRLTPARVTLKEAFRIIAGETGFKFVYLENRVPVKKKVVLGANLRNLEEALLSLSEQADVSFRRVNDRILATRIERKAPPVAENIIEKNIRISGTVTDSKTGEPLIGVSIIGVGTQFGTISDKEGQYTLEIPEATTHLTCSLIGYQSKTVALNNQTTLYIALEVDSKSLTEVIVVGYGQQEKRDVTGSIASVREEYIERNPQASPVLALQGQAPGVDIVASSFTSGSDPQIRIRGERSILASNNPLIVIDGIPFQGSLNDINASDIKSMEILKDASSTAIYGSRAANGVILITTKDGGDKLKINFTGYAGTSGLLRKVKMMNASEFAQFRREAQRTRMNTDGLPDDADAFDPFELDMLARGIDTDWQDQIYGQGSIRNYMLGLHGATDKTRYYVSASYFDESYLIKNVDFKRYNLRINLENNVTRHLTWGTNTLFARTIGNSGGLGGTDGIDQVYRTDPLSSPTDASGNRQFLTSEDPLRFNPLFNTDRDNYVDENTGTRVFPTLFLQLNLNDRLSYRVNAGGDIRFERSNVFKGKYATSQKGEIDNVQVQTSERLGYTLENILNYSQAWNAHELKFTGLFSIQQAQNIRGSMSALQLKQAPYVTFYGIGDAVQFPVVNNEMVNSQLASWMGRVNYHFRDRYLLTVTARYDGSSVFSPGRKWGFFPSVGLGWRVSDEPFLANTGMFSDLKLRASYGVTGNQAIDPYDSQAGLRGTNYRFADLDGSGFEVSSIENTDLGWEKTTQLDVGIDFGLLRGRLTGSADYYHAVTRDLLYQRRIPLVTGFRSVASNIGTTMNTGMESHLQSVIVNRKKIKWTVDVNASFNRNRIIDLYGDKSTDDIGNNLFIGNPLKVFYDNRFEGIWQSDEKEAAASYGYRPGDIRMADLDGDGDIDPDDREVLGSQFPKWTGGLSSSLTIHGADLSFLWITRQRYLVKNEFRERYNTLISRDGNVSIDYWTPENPSQSAPRPHRDDEPDNLRLLTYEDGSFIRLRNVSLGYTFPEQWLSRIRTQRLRVYVSLLNPLTITRFKGIDPEQPAYTGGTKFAQPGNYRQTVAGLNLTF